MKKSGYERVGVIGLEILPELTGSMEAFQTEDGKFRHREAKKYKIIYESNVKLSSDRFPVFKNNLSCVRCGLTGSYFAIEKNLRDINYHLNLYGIDKDFKEVMLTKDHILPKSKGGRNSQKNYQTMCWNCNHKKGNILESELLTEDICDSRIEN